MGKTDKILELFKIEKDSLVNELTKPPKKSISIGTFNGNHLKENQYHQADILYLPNDNGFKYLLVVVDIKTRKVQVRPQKSHSGKETLKNLKSIYGTGRRTLHRPQILHIDGGTEFVNSLVKNWLKANKILYRISTPFRHSQQSVVEAMNKIIGSAILKIQLNEELVEENDGEIVREWTTFIPAIIDLLNKLAKKDDFKPLKGDEKVLCKGSECRTYSEGMRVRVALNRDDFRGGDIRWTKKAHTIQKVLLLPNRPIMYMVNGFRNAFYKNELKPYKEMKANKIIEKYEVERLVRRFKKIDKIYFKVKWKGYRKLTDEPRSQLMRDIPGVVEEFERNHS